MMDQPSPPIADGRRASPNDSIGLTGRTVGDFWEWAYGDLVTNTVRSVFAEYVVALALGVSERPRVEWDRYDLTYRNVGIEVKAVGRVQAWTPASRPRSPAYDIAAKHSWDAATNTTAVDAGRAAAVWVFAECIPTEANSRLVADVDRWRFRVVSTPWLNDYRPTQKTISITELARLVPGIDFAHLRAAVDRAIEEPHAHLGESNEPSE